MTPESRDPLADVLNNRTCLFVASTGGHLAQLDRIVRGYSPNDDSIWLTFDSAQSRSLMQGRNVEYVDYVRPRDFWGVIKAALRSRKLLKAEFDTVISTGSALALSVLPQAPRTGARTLYVESVSRFDGPSLSGRILARTPGVETYTQHRSWASDKWRPVRGVLESYERVEAPSANNASSIFVTLGTIKGYRFDRLVDALLAMEIDHDKIVWQVGETKRTDLPGKVHDYLTADEFTRYVECSDIVITHAGVGTILQMLDLGRYPIVVPRSRKYQEHVDDHQFQVAEYLGSLGLAEVVSPDELTQSVLRRAANARIAVHKGA